MMANLPAVLLDKILLLAGYAATQEACKVNREWRERAEGNALWRFFILQQWPTLGKVVEVLDQREEPGAMRAFFRNRIVPEWERNPDRKSGKNEYLEAWTAFFQPLYLQGEVWVEGPDKTRRSLGAFTVHLGEEATVTTLFGESGVPVSGLPAHLSRADLAACTVQLTVLDARRGVSMLLVRAREYTPSRNGRLWKCGSLSGHHYEANVPWTNVTLEMRPFLMIHQVGSLRLRLEVDRAKHTQDLEETDEDGEYPTHTSHTTVRPSYYQLLAMLEMMLGITFRMR